jgi:hypothetical protein
MTSIIKVNNLQNQCGANTINKCGTAITVGASGDTVTLAAGASQSGFGQTYSAVSWDTTPKTGLFTAVSGVGYFCNTTSAPFTVTLPAGTAGDIVAFADYAATWQTNAVTVAPNGTDKIGSVNENAILSTEGQSVTFVFVDSTQGWINTMDSTSNVRASAFIIATGGSEVIVGDFKTHIFTGPGSFCVSAISPTPACNAINYIVVGGGATGGTGRGGGGGAGGFRMFSSAPGSNSPLNAPAGLPVSVQSYPIVIGGGGAAIPFCGSKLVGNPGNNSSFSSITSAGGGGGGSGPAAPLPGARAGGSGGGGSFNVPGDTGGAGNTPPVSPPQGNNGSLSCSAAPSSPPDRHGGGGGGAGAAGGPGAPENGGDGSYIAEPFVGPTAPSYGTPGPVGSTRYFSGGGGGGFESSGGGAGGAGGGATGTNTSSSTAATINTGGGGGAIGEQPGTVAGGGGSGIVLIRYKFQ